MSTLQPLPPFSLARGLPTLLVLFGLASAAAILIQLWKLQLAPPPVAHQSDKGKRLDPWRPLPGCITLVGTDGKPTPWPIDAATRATCEARLALSAPPLEGMAADETGYAPLLRALAPLRTPLRADANTPLTRIQAGENQILAGADIQLTLNSLRQAQASRLLGCLSGHRQSCAAAGIDADTWGHHREGAALRAGALLVMDIQTGTIEVAASQFSPCKTAEEQGQPLPQGCPPSARPTAAREWKLNNQALFADEMPGSLVKLIHLLALLRSDLGPSLLHPGPAREKLLENIQKSVTPDFLDRLFCKDRGYQGCKRLQGLLPVARELGWNQPLPDLLELSGAAQGAGLEAHPGRLLQTPTSPPFAPKPPGAT